MTLRRHRLVAAGVAAVAIAGSATATTSVTQVALPGADAATTVRLAALGDIGATANSTAVLSSIRDGGYDATLALGDLSYGAPGTEEAWCTSVKDVLGEGYPFELLAGNHESNGQNGHINNFSSCLPNQLPGLVGTYGRQYYVDVPREAPLARVVMVSANLSFPEYFSSFATGSPSYKWTENAIDDARAKGIPWVVLGTHYNCLGIANYECPSGPEPLELALRKKVDLYLNGHDHSYQRTRQLSLGPACPSIAADAFDADCIVDGSGQGPYAAGAGTIIALSGAGGVGLYPIDTTDADFPYYAYTEGSNRNPSYGHLGLTLTSTKISADFVSPAGTSLDSFVVSKEVAAPVQPVTGLTGSASEGSVGLAWSVPVDSARTGVEVSRGSTVLATLGASATGYTDPAPSAGQTHTYSVTALGADGRRSTSATVQVAVPSPQTQDPLLVARTASWKWRYDGAALPAGWTTGAFNDAGWASGASPLGFGWAGITTDVSTGLDPATRPLSAQFRKTFSVTNPSQFGSVRFDVSANDGLVLYLNGTEVGRRNLPTTTLGVGTYATAAPTQGAAVAWTFTVPASQLVTGTNVVTASMHLNYRKTKDSVFDLEVRGQ